MMPAKKKSGPEPTIRRVEPPTFVYVAYCSQCGTVINVHRKPRFAVQVVSQCLCPEGVSPLGNEAVTALYRRA
jgi:hypothetical protein